MSNLFHDEGQKANLGETKIMLATTAYDNPDASYTFSIQRSREALSKIGLKSSYLLLSGNCHVDDARNVVVQEFLLSDCSDLVFLDADVSWKPDALVKLCSYDEPYVIGGVYPYRREGSASRRGMPVRMIEGIHEAGPDGLMEVEGLPTGFMKIPRIILQSMANEAQQYWNKDDKRSKVPILFERCFDEDTEARWGGDLNFCRKAKKAGYRSFAIPELELGHTAKTIIRDTLGAALRRQAGTTLKYVCDQIREGKETLALVAEAMRFADNHFGALEDVLMPAIIKARQADGPIIEAGSGLSTILMAAANPDQTVFCLEHSPVYAQKLRDMAHLAGLNNIGLCLAPIKDGWYDLTEFKAELPEHFALGLNDGPPRTIGSRTGFFKRFGGKCDVIICDDAEDEAYMNHINEWAGTNDFGVQVVEPRAAILTYKYKGALV